MSDLRQRVNTKENTAKKTKKEDVPVDEEDSANRVGEGDIKKQKKVHYFIVGLLLCIDTIY